MTRDAARSAAHSGDAADQNEAGYMDAGLEPDLPFFDAMMDDDVNSNYGGSDEDDSDDEGFDEAPIQDNPDGEDSPGQADDLLARLNSAYYQSQRLEGELRWTDLYTRMLNAFLISRAETSDWANARQFEDFKPICSCKKRTRKIVLVNLQCKATRFFLCISGLYKYHIHSDVL